ncbi:DBF4-type zinc finger-containing protein 2 isoform X3 [Leuresthes tenuis]|uniref:DBF4-type zinc finger-containing protein 2 isoform X3 n=1 Tax=Leuresthes tenuis TaxID=355514 RepID=UPI003B500921
MSPVRMSDSSDEGKNTNSDINCFSIPPSDCTLCLSADQRKAEPASRMWAEPQPGPSRGEPSRHGYCGYCRVLYSNLDQHLSSLRHLDSVQTSSKNSNSTSSAYNRTRLTLLERFLQDVLQHHPHRYGDVRPSHADLPSTSAPLLPRVELDELHFSGDDSRFLGTQERLSSSDDVSFQPANQEVDCGAYSQSGKRGREERTEQKEGGAIPAGSTGSPHLRATPPQALPPVHRKAHRKTNRRKSSDCSSQPPTCLSPSRRPRSAKDPSPRQRERREAQGEVLGWDNTDLLDRTIEQVIQVCCHGAGSQQEETESFQLSLPVSSEKQTEDWDSPVQGVFEPADTPVQVTEGQDLGRLMNIQVHLEDRIYSHQLNSALHSESRGGARQDEGFWTRPIEEVLPAPEYIPESFRGKTWIQIEQEDEERVDGLVQQFRRGTFMCYFDTESLARYGRRTQNTKRLCENQGVEPAALPLVDLDDGDSAYVRRRRSFRLASRCQVVKVSRSTQTIRLVVPAVRQLAPEAPPPGVPAAERTPERPAWRFLPSFYSSIVTPVQPRTSLVYLLCSPSGSNRTTPEDSTPKRCRKRLRPLELQRLKVKYKRLPVRFYEPRTNRILKNPPKASLRHRGSAASSPSPSCVRQLFRSLSPDLNADRRPGEGPKGEGVLLGSLSRDLSQTNVVSSRGRMYQTPPPNLSSRSEQGRGGRRERTRPPTSKRRTRAQAPPPQPRREGLRRTRPSRTLPGSTGPAHLISRRSRGRRGRGCDRGRR